MCAPRHTLIRYSSSCHTRVNMVASKVFTAAMIRAFRSVRSRRRVFCLLCTKCTLHSNCILTRMIFQHTKRLLPGVAIFSLHTLASSSGRNVNYDEKQLTGGGGTLSCSFYLYRFRKYLSFGFPIINFCNLGVHYEMPCAILGIEFSSIKEKVNVILY
jgi:hypothetical protein